MTWNRRPLSVTILAWVYIGMGTVGFVYHLTELQATNGLPIRRHVGRTHPDRSDCLWSIYAPQPQLGTLACARLDFIPRRPECLSFVP